MSMDVARTRPLILTDAQERGRLRAAITKVYLGALGGLYSGLESLNLFD
jgi:hypothetical protein